MNIGKRKEEVWFLPRQRLMHTTCCGGLRGHSLNPFSRVSHWEASRESRVHAREARSQSEALKAQAKAIQGTRSLWGRLGDRGCTDDGICPQGWCPLKMSSPCWVTSAGVWWR